MNSKDEVELVNKGIKFEMQKIKEGKVKTKTLEQMKKRYEH
jgi:hypothetical protein